MNQDIKTEIKKSGLKQWKVADKCGVVESTFIRWLRFDLSDERKKAILAAIDELKAEGA